jgi:acyl transferase domain-containing protein
MSRDATALLSSALAVIEEMRQRIRMMESATRSPIAIVGTSCRVPGASDLSELWRLVADRKVSNSALPPDRWVETGDALPLEIPFAGSLFANIWGFDCDFFGIPPRQALAIDPQHRLLLELVCEAMDNAGFTRDDPAMTRTGLFAGLMHNEYADLLARADADIGGDAHAATGTDSAFATGRISYLMGWRGPSITLNTACSSSLVAVHAACRSLRAGECDTAFAGGVNLILTARSSSMLAHAGVLSPDGHCRPFDRRANGFGRAEGGGVIALRRLADAERAGDRILGLIRGSAVNHDGASGGLTVPCGRAQEILIASALADAGLAAADIDHVEAHGTGTRVGDPIELNALGAALGKGRDRHRPLLVGSLKSNFGHSEAAAGILGLLKTVAALNENRIPAQPDLGELNPLLNWDAIAVRALREPADWPRSQRPRIAGVSSFGMAGTNAHVIVEEAPAVAMQQEHGAEKRLTLPLSAREPSALPELAARTLRMLPGVPSLEDFCWSMLARRSHFRHSWVFQFSGRDELARLLERAAAGSAPPQVAWPSHPPLGRRQFVPGPAYPWQRQHLRPSFAAKPPSLRVASTGEARRGPTGKPRLEARGDVSNRLAGAPPSRRRLLLAEYLGECAEAVLGRKLDRTLTSCGFQDLGFDSISGVDFLRRVESGIGRKYAVTVLFEYPTIAILSDLILNDMKLQNGVAPISVEKMAAE